GGLGGIGRWADAVADRRSGPALPALVGRQRSRNHAWRQALRRDACRIGMVAGTAEIPRSIARRDPAQICGGQRCGRPVPDPYAVRLLALARIERRLISARAAWDRWHRVARRRTG